MKLKFLPFFKLFGYAELRVLLGNIKIVALLMLVVFASFWSIGFSSGIIQQLETKMDSPFISFLNIPLPYHFSKDDSNIQALRDSVSAHSNTYQYKNLEFISFTNGRFYHKNGKRFMLGKIRGVDPLSPLYSFILQEPGIIVSDRQINLRVSNWAVIVTKDFLFQLGFESEDEHPAYLTYTHNDVAIPLPISAVVSQLPNDCQVFSTYDLFAAINERYDSDKNPLLYENHPEEYRYFVPREIVSDLRGELEGVVSYSIEKNAETFSDGDIFVFASAPPKRVIAPFLDVKNFIPVIDFKRISENGRKLRESAPDYLSIQFDDLNQIEAFGAWLNSTFGLRLDMESIISRNNFITFNAASGFLSFALTLLCVIFIVFVISQNILNHIRHNAKSLGTLKAFGLSDFFIALIYFSIVLIMVLVIVLIPFIAVKLFGKVLSEYLFVQTTGIVNDYDIFSLPWRWTYNFVFILLPSLITSFVVFTKIKAKTPGDLIYSR